MARKIKSVMTESGTDRRDTGYYSTPIQVANYIAKRMRELKPDGQVLIDPCVGSDELLLPFYGSGIKLIGVDIIDFQNKRQSSFIECDFIDLYKKHQNNDEFDINGLFMQDFDYWIANPPYNCHEVSYIKDNKSELKILFSDVGVHNMYSMFISAMIDMASDGAILGFITLDSFLTSKAHSELRSKILDKCIIHDILLCPTDLFIEQGADVRTCIFIIEKTNHKNQGEIRLLNRVTSKSDFFRCLDERKFLIESLNDICLQSDSDNREFLIGVPDEIKNLFSKKRISDLFECVTGISTGNDKDYISNSRKEEYTIPFYKNPGSKKFFCEPNGFLVDNFIELSNSVKNFMVRNQRLLYKSGITCSSMGVEFSACFLPENSTYGVNPNIICDESDIWWLLAYLNSNITKYLIRGVLIRSNMVTSGYVSRVPVPDFTEEDKRSLSELANKGYFFAKNRDDKLNAVISEINQLVYSSINASKDMMCYIDDFCANIVKKA